MPARLREWISDRPPVVIKADLEDNLLFRFKLLMMWSVCRSIGDQDCGGIV